MGVPDLGCPTSPSSQISLVRFISDSLRLPSGALEAAQKTPLTLELPSVAKARELVGKLAENERAQKKIASMQNDMEYMRSNYQKASSAASEMRAELDTANAQNDILQRKASEF